MTIKYNLIGKVFGNLTIIETAQSQGTSRCWKCSCICGRNLIVREYNLIHGLKKNCKVCKKIQNEKVRFVDLTGQKINELTVLHISHYNIKNYQYYWRCLCDCGKETIVSGYYLKNKRTRSCGCLSIRKGPNNFDLNKILGKRFGRLIIFGHIGIINGKRVVKCLCDCGNTINVKFGSLKNGATNSCGCLKKDKLIERSKSRIIPDYGASFNRVWDRYRKRDEKGRNLSFKLTKDEFKILIQKNCYYCGAKPENNYEGYIYNGLDRVDNNKGYSIDNVVPCCFKCNKGKNILAQNEFFDWIKKVYENLNL